MESAGVVNAGRPDRAGAIVVDPHTPGRPDSTMTDPQILRRGEWKHVSPRDAGWTFVSFSVEALSAGATFEIPADGSERALVPLGGTAAVTAGTEQWEFGGRAN